MREFRGICQKKSDKSGSLLPQVRDADPVGHEFGGVPVLVQHLARLEGTVGPVPGVDMAGARVREGPLAVQLARGVELAFVPAARRICSTLTR